MHANVVAYEEGLPVGVDAATGELVEFERARANPGMLKPVEALSAEERKRLAQARIERAAGWPERELLPGGVVDRERALRELQQGTPIAEDLIETEVRVAAWVVARMHEEVGR